MHYVCCKLIQMTQEREKINENDFLRKVGNLCERANATKSNVAMIYFGDRIDLFTNLHSAKCKIDNLRVYQECKKFILNDTSLFEVKIISTVSTYQNCVKLLGFAWDLQLKTYFTICGFANNLLNRIFFRYLIVNRCF